MYYYCEQKRKKYVNVNLKMRIFNIPQLSFIIPLYL